jgi:uncharacterized protein with GYD domain
MPKYMIEATYTSKGLRGVVKDKASGRKAAIEKIINASGGKLEAVYYAFGQSDVFVLFDCPDAVTAAAISVTVSATGLVRTRTIPLLTVQETDQALSKTLPYQAPGS